MSYYKNYYNIFLLGFYSIISQIFIIREIFSTFSGNELSAGLILGIWLVGAGAGHILAKKLFFILFNRLDKLFFFNLTFFILNIMILRYFYNLFNFTFGEIISILYLLGYSIFLILPFSLLWGIHFNYFYMQLKYSLNKESKIYYIESAGAAFGALFTAFIGIHLNSVFLIITFLFFLYLVSLVLEKKYTDPLFYITIFIILILSLFNKPLSILTDAQRFKKLNVIAIKETPYGKMSVIKQDDKYHAFYNNGIFLFSTSDTITPEIDASLGLAQASSISNVLIINNGINGLIEKLLPYKKIKNITYVEYNKYLLDLYLKYTKKNYFNDPRLCVIINDSRPVIKQLRLKFNLIFLNIGDPHNMQMNRYYTYEFFKTLKSIMTDDGIIIFRISSSENFINKYQGLYIGSLNNTLKKVFNDVLLIPGDNCYILASTKTNILSYDITKMYQNFGKYEINSDFFENYFLKLNFNKFRIRSFLNSIPKDVKINYDLTPVCFFYNIALWTTRTSQSIKNFFFFLYKIKFYKIILFFIILFIILHFTILKSRDNLILLSMGSVGFTEISLEIITILMYQIIRGNIYINISLIFFSFMLGLTIGSYLYKKIQIYPHKLFVIIQFLFILIPFMLIPYFYLIKSITSTLMQDIMFFIFVFQFSILSGIQFPTAVNIYPDKIYGPGKINGVDLLSAAIGAFILSIFIIPLYGIFNTILLLSIINLLTFIKISALLKKPNWY